VAIDDDGEEAGKFRLVEFDAVADPASWHYALRAAGGRLMLTHP
jgi:hypothetical protein